MAASPQQPGGGWSHVPLAPQDQIPALAEEFKADADDHKVALCQGVYRSTDGSPYVLPSVREAERRVFERAQHHEYLSLVGLEGFTQASVSLCYGADRPAVRERRVAAIQSASGCAALRMAGEFVRRFRPDAAVYVSNPTWANHRKIFTDAGLAVREYRYLDTATMRLDVTGMLRDLADAPRGSSVVVQTCAHNPSGADPTLPQWDQIIDTCRRRGHTVVFDTAYQGFASGDTEADAQSLRRAADAGLSIIVCQSYSKNMGLYSERVGCWSIVCEDAAQAKAVQSQMCSIARGMISTAPAFGSRLVLEVLSDDTLRRQWFVP